MIVWNGKEGRLPGRREVLRELAGAVGAGIGLGWPTARAGDAAGQRFSGEVVRWIVPHGVGGGYDVYSRLIEPFLERVTGAEVVIENTPGAGGLVGAQRIMRAKPDGRTLGLVGAPGLLVSHMAGAAEGQPHVLEDFSVLGRVARSRQVWATGKNSGLRTMEDVFAAAARRPVVIGANEVGSTHFFNAVISAHLLGVDIRFVTGYYGSRIASTAAMRGEVDLVVYTFESILPMIEDGDLTPILQVSEEPIGDYPQLAGVPVIGGDDGLAARRARATGRDVAAAVADSRALVSMAGAGRLVVAPKGLAPDTHQYLDNALIQVLSDPEFEAAAGRAHRTLDVADAKVARGDLEAGVEGLNRFVDILRVAIRESRG